jgi:antitoxin ParD1/3/4
MNVSLTEPLQDYVRKQVKSGRYESASEVIRDSLRALQQRERAATHFWSNVNEMVGEARRQIAAGQTVDGETAMDEILGELGGKRPKRKKARR